MKKVDPFPKAKHPEVPTQYFGAILSIEGDTSRLKPGQRLRATIDPRRAAAARWWCRGRRCSSKDERQLRPPARAAGGGGFEPVPVTLGPGTVGRVVVTEGLDAGRP